MKILHVITGLNGGGAQRFLLDLTKHLPENFRNEVISLSNYGVIGEALSASGTPVTALEMNPAFPSLSAIQKLTHHIQTASPDIIHTWMYHSDLLGSYAARAKKSAKLLWAVHSPDTDRRYTKFRTLMIARACATVSRAIPDHIVYASEETKENHHRIGYTRKHSSVIPGGYDLSDFAPDRESGSRVRAELGIPLEAPVVGIIARFNSQKGFPYFFEMAKILSEQQPALWFVAAGRGVDATNLDINRWAAQAGISNRLSLLGPRKDVPAVLNALDVLVSPSLGEAGPLIVGEALAAGVPSVGTRVGLTHLLIGDPHYVTAPTDSREMAAVVNKILQMPAAERKALGTRMRQRILDNFNISRTAAGYAHLYESLVN